MLTWTLRHPTPDSPKSDSYQDPTQAAMVSFLSVYGSYAKHVADVKAVLGFLADIIVHVGYDRIAQRIREALDAVQSLSPSSRRLDDILGVARIITFPKDEYSAIWESYCQDPLLNDAARALRLQAYPGRGEVDTKYILRKQHLDDWYLAARHWE